MGIAYAKLTMRKLAQFVRIYVVMVGLYNWHVTMGILLMEMDARRHAKLSHVIHVGKG